MREPKEDILVRYANTKINKDITHFMESRGKSVKSVQDNKVSKSLNEHMPSIRYHEFKTPVSIRKRGTEDKRLHIIHEKLQANLAIQNSLTPVNFSFSNQLKNKSLIKEMSCRSSERIKNIRKGHFKIGDISFEHENSTIGTSRLNLSSRDGKTTMEGEISAKHLNNLFAFNLQKYAIPMRLFKKPE